jgi:hypothetical protein
MVDRLVVTTFVDQEASQDEVDPGCLHDLGCRRFALGAEGESLAKLLDRPRDIAQLAQGETQEVFLGEILISKAVPLASRAT